MKKAVFTVFTVFLLIFPPILQGNTELTAAEKVKFLQLLETLK